MTLCMYRDIHTTDINSSICFNFIKTGQKMRAQWSKKNPNFQKLWNQKQATFTYKKKSEEFVIRLQNDSPN